MRSPFASPAFAAYRPEDQRQALRLMDLHDISQLPVIREGDCVGHLAESTLMARVIEDTSVLEKSVQHLMDAPLPVVDAHVELPGITRLLSRQNPAVLVRRGGRLAGILTRYDVLRYITDGR